MTSLVLLVFAQVAAPSEARVLLYPAGKNIVPRLILNDQFENLHNVAVHKGDVVVLLCGDRKGADANKALGAAIHVAFHPAARGQPPAEAQRAPVRPLPGVGPSQHMSDVITAPLAAIGPVPSLMRGLICKQFQKASPDLPVWLDFDDQFKRQLGFAPGLPNIAVIDTFGRLRCLVTGEPTAAQWDALLRLIESLREEAVIAGR